MKSLYLIIGALVVMIAIFVVMYIRKKTPCDVPKCEACKDMTQLKFFDYYFSSEEQKLPQTFKIRERNTGLSLGLCPDNTTVCLNTNPLIFTVDNNVSVDDPLIAYISSGRGINNRLRAGNGKYLKYSSNTNTLILDTYNQTENRKYLISIEQHKSDGFEYKPKTTGVKIYTMDHTFPIVVTIADGNIILFKNSDGWNDDLIKSYTLWEIVPV